MTAIYRDAVNASDVRKIWNELFARWRYLLLFCANNPQRAIPEIRNVGVWHEVVSFFRFNSDRNRPQ